MPSLKKTTIRMIVVFFFFLSYLTSLEEMNVCGMWFHMSEYACVHVCSFRVNAVCCSVGRVMVRLSHDVWTGSGIIAVIIYVADHHDGIRKSFDDDENIAVVQSTIVTGIACDCLSRRCIVSVSITHHACVASCTVTRICSRSRCAVLGVVRCWFVVSAAEMVNIMIGCCPENRRSETL
jgi:hypothetical protein